MNRIPRTLVTVLATAGLLACFAACGESGGDDQAAADSSKSKAVLTASSTRESGTPSVQSPKAAEKRATKKQADTPVPGGDEASGPQPKLELGITEHDFGKLHSREPVTVMVPFRNVGTRTLHLNRISTSCGCTTAKLEKMQFEPGEGDEIEVTYTPKATGKRSSKLVTVSSNDPENAIQRIKITAWLIEPARLEPTRLQIGQIKAGEEHEATFTIISPDVSLEILDIEDESGLLSFEVVDSSNPNDKMFPCRKDLKATVAGKAPTGKLALPFKVKTKAAVEQGEEQIEVMLNGIILGHVRGDLLTEPRFLRIRNVDKNQDFEEKTLVYSESGQAFEITGTSLEDSMLQDVTVEFQKADAAEAGREGWWVILRGNTGNTTGAFRGTVVIETSLANEGPKTVQYNGVIRRSAPPVRGSSSTSKSSR